MSKNLVETDGVRQAIVEVLAKSKTHRAAALRLNSRLNLSLVKSFGKL